MTDLRDIKRLKRIKATCTACGNVRSFGRSEVAPIWKKIEQAESIPATWSMSCPGCPDAERTTQFLDWPDPVEKSA